MSIKDTITEAVRQGRIVEVLRGEEGYAIGFDQWVGAVAPTDWTKVIPIIYEVAESSDTSFVVEEFENAIGQLLSGSAEDVYIGVGVLYTQLLREASKRSPFSVHRENLIEKATLGVKKRQDDLKMSKSWVGEHNQDGLWTEIERYKRLMKEKFGLCI